MQTNLTIFKKFAPRKDIPWIDRINKAIVSKKFTEDDKEQAILWTTDPISEFYGVTEFKNGELKLGPIDIYLVLDGIFFTKAIEDEDLHLAVACYKSIRSRILKLHSNNLQAVLYCQRELKQL